MKNFTRWLATALLCIPLSLHAQQVTVKGKIADAAGVPLIGATVLEKGTQNGTVTDINGDFSLTVPDKSVLVVSMIGFASQEVTVNGNTPLALTLAEEVKGSGVTANVIRVKTIDTEHERQRQPSAKNAAWTAPEEIATAIQYLCSDAAGMVNGARLPLYGSQ